MPEKALAKKAADSETARKAIEAAATGLLFQSESDSPVTPLLWKKADLGQGADGITALTLLSAGKAPTGAKIERLTAEKLFAPMMDEEDWFGDEEKKRTAGFRSLLKTLQENLAELTAFRVGDVDIDAYILGLTADGDVAGVSTHLVET